MKRIIKDFGSLNDQHYLLIKEQYPKGFGDNDLVTLKTANGKYFDALEVRTNDAVYIVKVTHDVLERIDQVEELDLNEREDEPLPS